MLAINIIRNILKSSFTIRNLNIKYSLQRCSYAASITKDQTTNNQKPLGEIGTKYQVFQDTDADIILDVYEEKLKYQHLLEETAIDEDPFKGINLERGVSGVFDIEDLVDVLKRENAVDIFVAKVPVEIKYADYMCIVSGKSQKHMQAIVQFVKRVYKQKKSKGDIVPRTEGEKSNDWIALDLENIALHVFSKEARALYDLDTLWAVGPQYDDETNKPEPISEMLEKHSIYLQGLEPAS